MKIKSLLSLFLIAFLTVAAAPDGTADVVTQATKPGESYTLSAVADGTQPFTYQWQKGGAPIAGATSQQYVLTIGGVEAVGNYRCLITNSAGSTFTNYVSVTVIMPTLPPSNAAATITKR